MTLVKNENALGFKENDLVSKRMIFFQSFNQIVLSFKENGLDFIGNDLG